MELATHHRIVFDLGVRHPSPPSTRSHGPKRPGGGSSLASAMVAWFAAMMLLVAEAVAILAVAMPARSSAAPAHGTVVALSAVDQCTVTATRPGRPVTRIKSFGHGIEQEVVNLPTFIGALC